MKCFFYRTMSRLFSIILFGLIYQSSFAQTYALPDSDKSLIGETKSTTSSFGETLVNIAQRNNVGFDQISDANPHLNPTSRLASGNFVTIPGSHLLPALPRKGIIINLAEMRLYYFPKGSDVVMSYPIGIGRVGKTIPITTTAISFKKMNPTWIPPEDIRAFNEDQGITLPRVMPAGPDNPLGPYAIYLKLPTFLIHSTIFPDSVGRRASFGCIRMHEADVKEIFELVQAKTPVSIINVSTKVGWDNDKLYLETHAPLEEHVTESEASYHGMLATVENAAQSQRHVTFVDWQLIADLSDVRDGIPHEVGFVVH